MPELECADIVWGCFILSRVFSQDFGSIRFRRLPVRPTNCTVELSSSLFPILLDDNAFSAVQPYREHKNFMYLGGSGHGWNSNFLQVSTVTSLNDCNYKFDSPVSLQCGQTSSENCTYLTLGSTITTSLQTNCIYTICENNPNICRIRLDFMVSYICGLLHPLIRPLANEC